MHHYYDRYGHDFGTLFLNREKEAIQHAFSTIRSFIGAHAQDHFVLTTSGAEATLQVCMSAIIDYLSQNKKNHILTTSTETSILSLQKPLQKLGYSIQILPLNKKGQLTKKNVETALSSQTGLLSFSAANNYTGIIHPFWELAELCHNKKVLCHVDISGILGYIPFQFSQIPIDYITFEGTLLRGPQGSGGLCVHRNREFTPFIPKTNLHIINLLGLSMACDEMQQSDDIVSMEIARLRNLLEEEICKALPEVKIVFQEVDRLPSITAIIFPGISSELLAFHLHESGVMISFDENNSKNLEHLLTTIGIDPLEAQSAISFSLSQHTTEQEIRRAIEIIVDCAQKCRTYSERLIP